MKSEHPIEETSPHRITRVLGKVPLVGSLITANYLTIAVVLVALTIAAAGFFAGWVCSSMFGGYTDTLQKLGSP